MTVEMWDFSKLTSDKKKDIVKAYLRGDFDGIMQIVSTNEGVYRKKNQSCKMCDFDYVSTIETFEEAIEQGILPNIQ